MSLDHDLFCALLDRFIQISGFRNDAIFVNTESTLAALHKVNTVLNLLHGMLAEMNGLKVLVLLHVVQRYVVGYQCVQIELFKLILCVLDCIDNSCDAFLLSVEGRD